MINKKAIETALKEFAVAYGTPDHIDSAEKMDRVIDIYHRELSKHFGDKTISAAISVAWTKARRFPVVADFFDGYGGKKVESEPDFTGYKFDSEGLDD